MKSIFFAIESVYQEEVTFQSAGAAVEYVLDQVMPNDKLLVLTYIGVENETSAYTKLQSGVWDGGVFTPLFQQDSPSQSVPYWMENVMFIREGQRACAKLTGATANDFIKMRLQGYFYKIMEVEV